MATAGIAALKTTGFDRTRVRWSAINLAVHSTYCDGGTDSMKMEKDFVVSTCESIGSRCCHGSCTFVLHRMTPVTVSLGMDHCLNQSSSFFGKLSVGFVKFVAAKSAFVIVQTLLF